MNKKVIVSLIAIVLVSNITFAKEIYKIDESPVSDEQIPKQIQENPVSKLELVNLSPEEQFNNLIYGGDKYEDLLDIVKDGKALSPVQIEALRTYEKVINSAKQKPLYVKRLKKVLEYSSDNPPVIKTAKAKFTTISFLDNVGNSYPIESYNLSNTTGYSINSRVGQVDDKKGKKPQAYLMSSLTITSLLDFTDGELIVNLQGKKQPIHIFLEDDLNAYDYQVDLAVAGLSKESTNSITTSSVGTLAPSNNLLSVLNGVPKDNLTRVMTDDSKVQAYVDSKYIYVRTKMNLISPAYLQKIATESMNVYAIEKSISALSFVDNGVGVNVYLTIKKGYDDE